MMKVTLKAMRVNVGMSQQQAADSVGVSVDTWSNYERGKTFPDVPTIQKIENTFSVSYNDIIFLPHSTV